MYEIEVKGAQAESVRVRTLQFDFKGDHVEVGEPIDLGEVERDVVDGVVSLP